jgi:tripartite-type tricarboxylate transporter receptor subunit TctC
MIKRRQALLMTASMALGGAGAASAQTDSFPTDTLKFVCGFPPGSGADVIVRHFAEKIRPLAGRNIIVENKPGANGMLALTYTAKSKPDGHTVYLAGGNAVAANMHLIKDPQVDARREIVVAATINAMPFMLGVDANSPYQGLGDLTAALAAKKGKASYAYSSAFGKVIAELYKVRGDLETVGVSYRAATDSLNELASGVIDFGVYDPFVALAQAKAGKMRILAVSTSQRTQASADLRTFREQGVDVDLPGWWAAMVPSGTPKANVQKLNDWFKTVLETPETQEFTRQMGSDTMIMSTDAAQALFIREIDAWRDYVRLAKIDPQ